MDKTRVQYYVKKVSKLLVSLILVLLFFIPSINELYEVYAHNHSLHCTAEHENHLHKDHETFLYNNTVVNDYFFISRVIVDIQQVLISDINKVLYKSIQLSEKLIVFYLRPPPNN